MPRTNTGLDWQADSLGNAAARPAVANFIGLSADATVPSVANTALAGEITTVNGGLIRGAAAAYAHTTGASTYTLTKTYTANASDVLPVTLKKVGVFNAAAGGVMPFTDSIADAAMGAVGDQVTVTVTVTL